MAQATIVKSNSNLEFGDILEGLLLNPEAYINFGKYWWTLKRMIADWAEENGSDIDPDLLRGTQSKHADEVDESEVYRFLDQFSCKEDFMDWIAYVNPLPALDEVDGYDAEMEDPEWEENFL